MLIKDTYIRSGYAEKDGDDTLYIYGNSYEIILYDKTFQKNV